MSLLREKAARLFEEFDRFEFICQTRVLLIVLAQSGVNQRVAVVSLIKWCVDIRG